MQVARVLNGGYSGRDQDQVRAHIDELARIGVPAPARTPTLYPISDYLLTQSSYIQVQHERTSGEIEYALIWAEGTVFVTVGSDQTDRALETHSVARAKQACPNVIAREVWALQDVEGNWDELSLRCWTTDGGRRLLFQEGALSQLLPPAEWLPILEQRGAARDGTVFFSGTMPAATEGPIYGESYELELHDPRRERSITSSYAVEVLPPALE
ncbi:MAG: DUF2848 domain-containing protein [Actinomycetota bacterium]